MLRALNTLVTPDTLLAWHRKLIARKCDGAAERTVGRPRGMDEIRNLVVQMARENVTRAYTRILGHSQMPDGRVLQSFSVGSLLTGSAGADADRRGRRVQLSGLASDARPIDRG